MSTLGLIVGTFQVLVLSHLILIANLQANLSWEWLSDFHKTSVLLTPKFSFQS